MAAGTRLGRAIYKLIGWSNEGKLPYDVKKCVVVVYPHTSNLDFPIGIVFNYAFGFKINYVGKASLFKPPIGGIMRALGGRPVERSRNTNFVDNVAKIFEKEETFRLCITPEGTRSKPEKIKSGFFYLAHAAKVPIIFVAFHWDKKVMRWGEPFFPSESYEETLDKFHDFFRGTNAYHQELAYEIPPDSSKK